MLCLKRRELISLKDASKKSIKSSNCSQNKPNWIWFFEILNLNFVLNLGYLNPALNNSALGPVVWTPVSANPGFNPGFFFFLSKALCRIIFSLLFRVSNHQIIGKVNLTELAF